MFRPFCQYFFIIFLNFFTVKYNFLSKSTLQIDFFVIEYYRNNNMHFPEKIFFSDNIRRFSMEWLDSIKKIKKEKGLTNEQLSEVSGISLGTLNKLLSGATADPKLSTLSALSLAFSCSFDELLGNDTRSASAYESETVRRYYALDAGGRETADYIINKEYNRLRREKSGSDGDKLRDAAKKIRTIRLFSTAASAGTGSYLSDDDYTNISVYSNSVTDAADFAIRVRGNSMEPKYSDGDILLVSDRKHIDIGELGIFSVDGESYFKQYGGNRLISLNPDYSDIPLDTADKAVCFGKVIGKLKK